MEIKGEMNQMFKRFMAKLGKGAATLIYAMKTVLIMLVHPCS